MKHRFTIDGMLPHGEDERFTPFLITWLINFCVQLLFWGGYSFNLRNYAELAEKGMLDSHQHYNLLWMLGISEAYKVHVAFAFSLLFCTLFAIDFYNYYHKTGIRYVMMRVQDQSDMWFRILSLPVLFTAISFLAYLGTFAGNIGQLLEIGSYVAQYT